jgi:hypothetical protein
MIGPSDPTSNAIPPSEVCLLLRAHAQQNWLNREVLPVLNELRDRDSSPEEQVEAAVAYLEVLWIEASMRAAETDAAFAQLNASSNDSDNRLHEQVRRFHAAVLTLHRAVESRVRELISAPFDTRAGYPSPW